MAILNGFPMDEKEFQKKIEIAERKRKEREEDKKIKKEEKKKK